MLVGGLLAGLALSAPAATTTVETAAAAATPAIPSFTVEEMDSGEAIRQLGKMAYDNAMARLAKVTTGACTKDNVKVRREW